MHVLMLFLDGVGMGKKDPRQNPFFAAQLPVLRGLLGGALPSLHHRQWEGPGVTMVPLDATLGVAGLPQSGTGQTALFTGVNAARLIGKHFGPYPYSTLRPVIEAHSIFQRLQQSGQNPCFANAFPQRFFDYIKKRQTRTTVTTFSCLTSGVPLKRAEDLLAGTAISPDLTGEAWAGMGYPDVRVLTTTEAGGKLAGLAAAHPFVLFEYWKTDHAGHGRKMPEAIAALEAFDGFLGGILDTVDRDDVMLVITSDHGNLEDLSTKTHTRNPVPLIIAGLQHRMLARRLAHFGGRSPDLTHVLPALLEVIRANGKEADPP